MSHVRRAAVRLYGLDEDIKYEALRRVGARPIREVRRMGATLHVQETRSTARSNVENVLTLLFYVHDCPIDATDEQFVQQFTMCGPHVTPRSFRSSPLSSGLMCRSLSR